MKKKFLFVPAIVFISGILLSVNSLGQSLAINTDGSTANAAAILDVKSFTKGILIPRTKTSAVTTTVKGLMIYDTTTNSFWFHNGTIWSELATTGVLSGWSTSGNAGTSYGPDFIGNTDNQSLLIKVQGQVSGRIENGSANYNTSFGFRSLSNITTGADNVAIGTGALQANTTGKGLTAIGDSAAYNTDIAAGIIPNVAVGYKAMLSNTTGWNSVAVGYQALYKNTTGWSNVAVGPGALFNNNGLNNAGFGFNTLASNLNGYYNIACGSSALVNSTGFQNSGFGGYAIASLNAGNNNTGLGYGADVSTATMNNATVIGANAIVNADNKVRIGSSSVTVIEGQVAYTFPSDGRFKYNINDNDIKGLDFILKLKPVEYNFDTKKFEEFLTKKMPDSFRKKHLENMDFNPSSSIRQSGFVAQDVEKAMIQTGYDFNGLHKPANENDNYSLAYSLFVVPLVKGMQEQQKMIEQQAKELTSLKILMNQLVKKLDQ